MVAFVIPINELLPVKMKGTKEQTLALRYYFTAPIIYTKSKGDAKELELDVGCLYQLLQAHRVSCHSASWF